MSTSLRIENLVKNYSAYSAVNDVSIDVAAGNTLVLLGPSGCGKTSILRCIAGLEKIDSGIISIAGKTASGSGTHLGPEQRAVGMVFQSYALWPHMRVLDNVMFSCRRQAHLGRSQAKTRAEDLLERFGLTALADRRPAALSGGQQQRVALARAIGGNPALLLMDEPLSALDPQLRDALRVELRSTIANTGLACVYVTHDQREALAMADQVAVMNQGKITELASPAQIYAHPQTVFGASFLGSTNRVSEARVSQAAGNGRWLAEHDGEQIEFTPTQSWTPSAGALVDVSWRPEATTLAPADTSPSSTSAPNAWPARVQTSVFVGAHHEVLVQTTGGQRLMAVAAQPWAIDADCIATTNSKEMIGYAST